MTYVPNSSAFAELDAYTLTRTAHLMRAKAMGDMVRALFSPASSAEAIPTAAKSPTKPYDFSHSPEAENYMKHANFIVDTILGVTTFFKQALTKFAARTAELRVIDELRAFDERQLADIGISRADIERAVHGDLRHDETMVFGAANENGDAVAANSNTKSRFAA